MLAALRPAIADFLVVRADLAELRADLASTGHQPVRRRWPTPRPWRPGSTPSWSGSRTSAPQVKGYAPLLLDFPGERDGEPVLWCWLEGDAELPGTTGSTPDSQVGGLSSPRDIVYGRCRWPVGIWGGSTGQG